MASFATSLHHHLASSVDGGSACFAQPWQGFAPAHHPVPGDHAKGGHPTPDSGDPLLEDDQSLPSGSSDAEINSLFSTATSLTAAHGLLHSIPAPARPSNLQPQPSLDSLASIESPPDVGLECFEGSAWMEAPPPPQLGAALLACAARGGVVAALARLWQGGTIAPWGIEVQLAAVGDFHLVSVSRSLTGVLALLQRAGLHESEVTDHMVLAALWVLQLWFSQEGSNLCVMCSTFVELLEGGSQDHAHAARALRAPLVARQHELLRRCGWQVRLRLAELQVAEDELQAHPDWARICTHIEYEAMRCLRDRSAAVHPLGLRPLSASAPAFAPPPARAPLQHQPQSQNQLQPQTRAGVQQFDRFLGASAAGAVSPRSHANGARQGGGSGGGGGSMSGSKRHHTISYRERLAPMPKRPASAASGRASAAAVMPRAAYAEGCAQQA